MCNIIRPKARRLKCNDPRTRDRWKKLYTEYIKKNKVHTLQFKIESTTLHQLTPELKDQYEEVLKMRKLGMEYADSNCQKLCMGGVPYSPEFQKHHKTIKLWKAVIKGKKDVNTVAAN